MKTNMNDELTIKDRVSFVFSKIESKKFDKSTILIEFSKTFNEELEVLDRNDVPKIEFSITPQDIKTLEDEELIDADSHFIPKIASADSKCTPLERLMYAILWKNGDLKKVSRIIDGIKAEPTSSLPEQSFVFHQFGRFLNSKSEPLIDQHVMRVYKIYKSNADIAECLEKELTAEDAQKYIEWVKETEKNNPVLKNDIDEILFALGRKVNKIWQSKNKKRK